MRWQMVSPHDVLRLLKQPRGDTRAAVRSADYMGQTLRLLQERSHHAHKRSLNATGQAPERTFTDRRSEVESCSSCLYVSLKPFAFIFRSAVRK